VARRDDEIGQLETAIAAQEALRPTLGDAIVAVAIAALRARVVALQAEPGESATTLLLGGSPERFLTAELAVRMRESGRARGDRRQVTVLFADLTGHTALGENLDPEELAALSNDVLRVLAEAVYAYEGTVDKFLGDSVLALFGAPLAHEDDPVRALYAALMMREHLESVNRAWTARLGEPLTLHVGVNTGVVVAGNVGTDLHLEYTVIGDTINTASRLQAAAPAGEILVSREAYRLTQHAFIFEALDPIAIRGKREPVPVFALRRARVRPLPRGERAGTSTVLVGRASEMATLRAIGHGIRTGRGRILVVSGEAGIGKSRLLAEWRRDLGDDFRWLEGRALVHAEALAYGPFIDLIRRLAGITDEHSESQARDRLRQALANTYPEDPETLALFASFLTMRLTPEEDHLLRTRTADWRRRRLTELIRDGLVTLSQSQPTVAVIEDLHWADASTIELVGSLLPLVESDSVVIALVIRNAADPRIAGLMRAVQASEATRLTGINLGPLTEPQSSELIDQLLARGALPTSLRESIVERTAGNPFFVEEVMRSLIERGVLMRAEDGDGWSTTSLAETVSVPDTLQGLLMSRLDRLPAETKWTIQQAAVIGRIFLYRVLRWVADNSALDSDLSYLEREELIRQRVSDPEVEFIFKHALTQEIAYASLLSSQRRSLHRRVGEALEALMVERLAEYNSTIANHYLRGEAWERASKYLLRAGDAATWLGAYPEARRLYSDCLTASSHLDTNADHRRIRVDALLKLVEVSLTSDQPSRNVERLAEAEQILNDLVDGEGGDDDRHRRAWLHLWRGRVQYYLSDLPSALRSYNEVLALAKGTDDPRLLTYPSSAIGMSRFALGHFREALPLLTQAMHGLDEATDRREWLTVSHYRAMAIATLGDYRDGMSELRQLNERVREFGDPSAIAFSHIALSVIHAAAGEHLRSWEEASTAAKFSEMSSDRVFQFVSSFMCLQAETRLGRLNDASISYARAQAIVDAIAATGGRPPFATGWMAVTAEFALAQEDLTRAASLAEEGMAAAGEFDVGSRIDLQVIWVQSQLRLGVMSWADAQVRLEEGVRNFEAVGATLSAARHHAIWARLCREYGDPLGEIQQTEKARAFYDAAGLSGEW
jgi:class 3 adenylate cyclase/tetratricopeptide (TPR) repeat protein